MRGELSTGGCVACYGKGFPAVPKGCCNCGRLDGGACTVVYLYIKVACLGLSWPFDDGIGCRCLKKRGPSNTRGEPDYVYLKRGAWRHPGRGMGGVDLCRWAWPEWAADSESLNY